MAKRIQLNTVNIIELVNGKLHSIRSFTDNKSGNKQAESLFRSLVKEHNSFEGPSFNNQDFVKMIDDGIYDDDCGYELIISHSTK